MERDHIQADEVVSRLTSLVARYATRWDEPREQAIYKPGYGQVLFMCRSRNDGAVFF